MSCTYAGRYNLTIIQGCDISVAFLSELVLMEVRSRRVEKLERILKELMEIHALPDGAEPRQFRLWLDLAITETRTQLEKVRMETVH